MELRHFRYAIAVAEELHFGRAAQRLNISQPPLSQQIRKLEEELGVKLFHRTKRQVQLTGAGRCFVEEARRILKQVDSAVKLTQRTNQAEVGHLAVGTFSGDHTLVLDSLRRFTERHPHVHLELRSLNSTLQIQAILEDSIQLGFIVLPVAESALTIEKLCRSPMVVALPKKHPLADQRRISLAALSSEPFVMLPRPLNPGYYDHVLDLCRVAGFRMNVAYEVDNAHTSLALVAAGLGVWLVDSASRNDPFMLHKASEMGVVFVRFQPPVPYFEQGIAFKPNSQSPTLQAFLTIVRQLARERFPLHTDR